MDGFTSTSNGVGQFSRSQFNPLLFNVSPSNFPTTSTTASGGLHQFSSAQFNPLLFRVSPSNFPIIPSPEFSNRNTLMQFPSNFPSFQTLEFPPSTTCDSVSDNPKLSFSEIQEIIRRDHQQREKRMANSEKYRRLLNATEGFCAGNWDESDLDPIYNGIHPCPNNTPNAFFVAEYAVSFLNKSQVGGDGIKVKRIISVNGQLLKRLNYFMTLEASDDKFYEADVYLGLDNQTKELTFIRPAKYYPTLPNNLRHLIGPDADEGPSSCR